MGLFHYVRLYTTTNPRAVPFDEGLWIYPWRDYPFGSFLFYVFLPRDRDEWARFYDRLEPAGEAV